MDEQDFERIFERVLEEEDLSEDWQEFKQGEGPNRVNRRKETEFLNDIQGKIANWFRREGMKPTESRIGAMEGHIEDQAQTTFDDRRFIEGHQALQELEEEHKQQLERSKERLEQNFNVKSVRVTNKGTLHVITNTNKSHRVTELRTRLIPEMFGPGTVGQQVYDDKGRIVTQRKIVTGEHP